MSLSVKFLGTSASRPTVERNVSSIALMREGETLLFDCGEGTQRQMMRYGIAFSLEDIFFTHFHADHVLGVIGLFRTMALQGRTERMRLWGPRGAERILRRAGEFGGERVGFPVTIVELEPGTRTARKGYEIVAIAAEHRGGPALTYALVEEERRGRFNVDAARELGIPEGPLWGQIHRNIPVTLPDGRIIDPSTIVGARRPGRTIVITGDTRPCDTTVDAARNADLLVHESTFGEEEAQRAVETGHSTAREAAEIASRANVRRLVLTHFSARYSGDTAELLREARAVFPATTCARDGMEVEVGFVAEEGAETPAER
jgi:ribonuclease Z